MDFKSYFPLISHLHFTSLHSQPHPGSVPWSGLMGGICPNDVHHFSPIWFMVGPLIYPRILLLYIKKNIKPSSDRSEAYLCCIPRSQAQTAMRFFALFFCKDCAEAGRSEGSGCDLDCSKKATWLLQPLQIPWPALGFSMVLTKSLRWTQGSQRLSTIVQPSWSAGPSKTW